MSHTGCEEQGNLLIYGTAALSDLSSTQQKALGYPLRRPPLCSLKSRNLSFHFYSSCAVQVTGNLQAVQNGLAAICAQLRINPGKAWSEPRAPLTVSLLTWAARYNTGLLSKLTPKGVVFSSLFKVADTMLPYYAAPPCSLCAFITPVKPVSLTAEHAQHSF